jgi:hypothetical protein
MRLLGRPPGDAPRISDRIAGRENLKDSCVHELWLSDGGDVVSPGDELRGESAGYLCQECRSQRRIGVHCGEELSGIEYRKHCA